MNPIELSLFTGRMNAICEEMGAQLRRAAFSPNIRERLDFSCAVFDANGELCAQAAHIPVHLGSMAFAMRDIVRRQNWCAGDMLVLNDPYQGGTHLPDVTVVAPVFYESELAGFVANRAHHADIGADSPGSMPLSHTLEEEGILIQPTLIVQGYQLNTKAWKRLLSRVRTADAAQGDFHAQISANLRGLERLEHLINGMGMMGYTNALTELNAYAERMAQLALRRIPKGSYLFRDIMDDDGQGMADIEIKVCITSTINRLEVDFSGTALQVSGNINCPLPVTAAAVFYVLRTLMPPNTPACAGAFRPIRLIAPEGTLINAQAPAAVAAGNVETSMRIVDCVLGALAHALPDRIPAASAGTMNNVALGWSGGGRQWDYYETIGGGAGAAKERPGQSAVQTHMTNTLNTPIEAVEMSYPMRIIQYAIRRHSGGLGQYAGGDGIVREYTFLSRAEGTVLSERRSHNPWGREGGGSGQAGRNLLNRRVLPGKSHFRVEAGDRLRIETPGGGAYGGRRRQNGRRAEPEDLNRIR